MSIQRWTVADRSRMSVVPAQCGDLVTYDDHVAAVDAAVAETRQRAYMLMGASIESAIEAERLRIRGFIQAEIDYIVRRKPTAEAAAIDGLEMALQITDENKS